ncbi:hypothetical protein [Mesorhizobium japonicum]|uniref:Mll0429 protein n=1 Tax=Mesorhizobium japonicum (strain LMG 29417 / CECT 9101 / MAFF 303099) TaxID=266835 RepID=Q98MV0_RHILO|nr:hypothetical protein [Mesorhizobium japonicum]BAB48013.1 mll0429 [Mesorhizobium japonicum MAFF 303099]
MPNTSVRAAAEGMPKITRRHALMMSSGAIVALAVAPNAHAAVAVDDVSEVRALIKAHRDAEAAFEKALVADGEMEEAYFAAHPERELLIPLSIGGAQSLYIRFEAQEYLDDCVKAIASTYNAKRQSLAALRQIAPALANDAVATLDRAEAVDLSTLDATWKAEQAKRKAFGWGKTRRAYNSTCDAMHRALDAICTYRCSSPAANRARAAYLLKVTGGKFADLENYQVRALLRSMRAREAQS